MYLRFKNQVQLLGMKFKNDIEMKLEYYEKYAVARVTTGIVDFDKAIEDVENFSPLIDTLHKHDKIFTHELGMIYKDLHTQLELKHERLIKELDY